MRDSLRTWVSYLALAVGIGSIVASLVVSSTPVGQGLTFASGAFIVFFAVLSLPVRDKTPQHWGLVVIGLAMVMLPWLGAAFVPDPGAAWTAGVAGALALVLGCLGWLSGRPPTVYGISKYGARDAKPGPVARWISRGALVVGLLTVVMGATVTSSSAAGVAVTAGLGGFVAIVALWSMLSYDPTLDYFTLAIFGFALVLAPAAAGFVGEAAAWTAWVGGGVATALGVTGYLRGANLDVSRTVREEADARYRRRYRRRAA